MRPLSLITAILGAAASPTLAAQTDASPETGAVTARVGYSYFDFKEWGAANPNGDAGHIYVAYGVSPWLSIEAGWLNGSRVSGDIVAAPITIRPDRRTVEPAAFTIGPRFTWRLPSGLSFYGVVGYAYTSHFYSRTGGTLITPDFTIGETRHDDEVFFGAGAGYAITDRTGVQLDYRRMEFSDLPFNSIGLMASYRF